MTSRSSRISTVSCKSVHHDFRLMGLLGRRIGLGGAVGRLVLLFGVVAHLHVLVAVTTILLVKVVVIIITFIFDVLTFAVRDVLFFLFLDGGWLGAFHVVIFRLGSRLLLGIGKFFDKSGFKFGLLSTISTAVVVQVVGFGLVGGVFGGGRFLRVPSRKELAMCETHFNNQRARTI